MDSFQSHEETVNILKIRSIEDCQKIWTLTYL